MREFLVRTIAAVQEVRVCAEDTADAVRRVRFGEGVSGEPVALNGFGVVQVTERCPWGDSVIALTYVESADKPLLTITAIKESVKRMLEVKLATAHTEAEYKKARALTCRWNEVEVAEVLRSNGGVVRIEWRRNTIRDRFVALYLVYGGEMWNLSRLFGAFFQDDPAFVTYEHTADCLRVPKRVTYDALVAALRQRLAFYADLELRWEG